ncbi:MAG TPA: membrane protein insertion efficiency factor YidD [Patescibacteria group bacterium]
MKYIALFVISVYQWTLSPILQAIFGPNICRYKESCSSYAKRVIKTYGVFKGVPLAFIRLLSCQPFGRIQKQ